MRTLLGIILGVILTIGGAYIYDSHNALAVTSGSATSATAERPLVNWEIVGRKWERLTIRARGEWNKLTTG
ncbi:MAG: hypothetical protein WCI56_05920 [Hyphomicrobiales bacterium]